MGNASGRDRIQQMDDGEPNLFQPKVIGYPDTDFDNSPKVGNSLKNMHSVGNVQMQTKNY